MFKVILVICFLIALCFVVQGFISVASADDLFEPRENSSSDSNEVSHE